MTQQVSHGATMRQPVYSGNPPRRIPGLYQRTLAGGGSVFEARLRLDGRVQRHRLQATTKTDAVLELRALQVDYARGEGFRSPATAPTVGELAAAWLDELERRVGHRDPRRRRSARTVNLYRQRLRQHILPLLQYRPAAEVTTAEMRLLLDRLDRAGLSPSTAASVLYIASGLFRFGVKRGALTRNPVRDLDRDDRPTVARASEPRYLTRDELERVLAQMGDTFRPVAACCAYAGLRASEALGLRWGDLDLERGLLTVTGQLSPDGGRVPVKTGASQATVPLLPALARNSAHTVPQPSGAACCRCPPRSCSPRHAVGHSHAATRSGPFTRPVTPPA